MQQARAARSSAALLAFPVLLLLAMGVLTPSLVLGDSTKPTSLDPRAGLAPMARVPVQDMGPVDVVALRAEDAATSANREHFARWLTTGGPAPPTLLYELDEGKREIFGDWLLAGGPVPQTVLAQLPAQRRAALAGSSLDAGRSIPDALLAELPGMKRLLEKTRRVGFAMPALTPPPRQQNLSPANSGVWEDLEGGGQVWRLRVRSEDARWLVLGFRTFRPLQGARLYIFEPGGETTLGPFTTRDIREHRQLWTPPIDADEVAVELYWPEGLRGVSPDIVLSTVSHGYKNAWDPDVTLVADEPFDYAPPSDLSVDGSGSCNVNVACEPTWSKEKRGIMHMLISGQSWCTGSLINNTAGDCTHYVLTAAHCYNTTSEAASAGFRFNYEREECGGGGFADITVLTGSFLRAARSATDFALLEMDDAIPEDVDVYFNGWSRAATPAPEATCIHHPSGDDKKISFEFDPLGFGQSSGWGSDHWRVADWDSGTTEGGSSGSPLFDTTDAVGDTPHIIGQLHGGQAACSNNSWDEYGRLDLSWDAGGNQSSRLREWLDPLGIDPATLGGKDHAVCLNPIPDILVQDYVVLDYRGNADGYPDPGESIELRMTLLNTLDATATEVSGSLSTAAGNVIIPRATGTWADLPSGGGAESDAPHFDLQIDPAYPCDPGGSVMPLTLELDYAESAEPVVINFDLPLGTPVPTVVFDDDLEPSPETGWTHAFTAGPNWSLNNSVDPNESTSSTHAWFVNNSSSAGKAPLKMPVQPFGGGTLGAQATLRFQHRFLTDDDTDGGMLEYSLDGTTWYDINHDLTSGLTKNRFLANGYNGTISSILDRAAWEGDSGGWLQVEVDLSDFEGQTLQLRYFFSTNSGNSGTVEGWFIDDVVIEYVDYNCSISLEAPGAITDMRLGKGNHGRVLFEWQPPVSEGGAIMTYLIQETPLGPVAPQYVADVGPLPSAVLFESEFADGGILIVGENSVGTGPTGDDSEGDPRPPAQPAP